MAIAPSNNLLTALSQLQGNARPTASAKPPAGIVTASFASQITAPPAAAGIAAPTAPSGVGTSSAAGSSSAAPAPTLPRQAPVPSRGGYLGQYVNIVV